jgi:hypothetical protein
VSGWAGHPLLAVSAVSYGYHDGGRAEAGFRGPARDCVTRAVAIAAGRPYRTVYDELSAIQAGLRRGAGRARPHASARDGVIVQRKAFRDYMAGLGFAWTPTMAVGAGCTVHVHHRELPKAGRLVLHLSRHCAAYVDGILFDTHDCSRGGTRCVYGYWTLS